MSVEYTVPFKARIKGTKFEFDVFNIRQTYEYGMPDKIAVQGMTDSGSSVELPFEMIERVIEPPKPLHIMGTENFLNGLKLLSEPKAVRLTTTRVVDGTRTTKSLTRDDVTDIRDWLNNWLEYQEDQKGNA